MRIRIPLFAAVLLLVAAAGSAQPFFQVGSASASGAAGSDWIAGGGWEAHAPVIPVSAGVLVQTTIGSEETSDVWPARAYGFVRAGFLPTPLVRAYAGVGAGYALVVSGRDLRESSPAGLALAGFSVGRVSLEVQYQRDFLEEPVNRWVTTVGVSF